MVLKFEGVVARPVPSLCEYLCSLIDDASFDLEKVVTGFYGSRRPWESYFPDVLARSHVPEADVLEIVQRASRALGQPEAWRIFEDVPLALRWLGQRRIPVVVIHDWPLQPADVIPASEMAGNILAIERTGSLGDAFWQVTSRIGVSIDECLYVAADFESDYEDARTMGAYSLVMDRQDAFDEQVPNVNHLIEVELHI